MNRTFVYERKHNKEVEAIQITKNNIFAVATWCNGSVNEQDSVYDKHNWTVSDYYIGLDVPINGYIVRANLGDYVLRENGLFYVRKAHNFESKYQRKVSIAYTNSTD